MADERRVMSCNFNGGTIICLCPLSSALVVEGGILLRLEVHRGNLYCLAAVFNLLLPLYVGVELFIVVAISFISSCSLSF